MPHRLEFWFEFGSTYSYPAAMRIEKLAEAAGVAAKDLDIFGAPTFLVDKEMFWGNDRLEETLAWVRPTKV